MAQAGRGLFLHGAQWMVNGQESVSTSVEVLSGRIARIYESASLSSRELNLGTLTSTAFRFYPASSMHTIISSLRYSHGWDLRRTAIMLIGVMTFTEGSAA